MKLPHVGGSVFMNNSSACGVETWGRGLSSTACGEGSTGLPFRYTNASLSVCRTTADWAGGMNYYLDSSVNSPLWYQQMTLNWNQAYDVIEMGGYPASAPGYIGAHYPASLWCYMFTAPPRPGWPDGSYIRANLTKIKPVVGCKFLLVEGDLYDAVGSMFGPDLYRADIVQNPTVVGEISVAADAEYVIPFSFGASFPGAIGWGRVSFIIPETDRVSYLAAIQ